MKKLRVPLVMLALASGLTFHTVSAQQTPPNPPNPPGGAGFFGGGALICSTTNSTDVAAKALGISSTDLRVALVGGKTLTQIASDKSVALQTVTDALNTARKADVDQALKDGLITQAQHDAMVTRMTAVSNDAANDNANDAANDNANDAANDNANDAAPAATAAANATPAATAPANAPRPRNGNPRGFGGGFGIAAYNVVNPEVTAATAIGVTCPDLVKAMQGGQTIAQIATSKNVQAQTVIDALVTAYKGALAEDVKEGLITQTQADGRTAQLSAAMTRFVNQVGRQRGFGPGPNGGNGPDNGPRGNGNNPNAPATPAATQSATTQS